MEYETIKQKYRYLLVIDLEATCSEDNTVPRHEMEIIEIGAVMLDIETLQPVDEFQVFIKPIRHQQLTPFCTNLTSITQEMVDAGVSYQEAINQLGKWTDPYQPCLFCSWGDYDRKQFYQDSQFHGVKYPFGSGHLNLKLAFSERLGTKNRFGMAGALKKCGIELKGVHHRGIDDAQNISRLVPYIFGREEYK